MQLLSLITHLDIVSVSNTVYDMIWKKMIFCYWTQFYTVYHQYIQTYLSKGKY